MPLKNSHFTGVRGQEDLPGTVTSEAHAVFRSSPSAPDRSAQRPARNTSPPSASPAFGGRQRKEKSTGRTSSEKTRKAEVSRVIEEEHVVPTVVVSNPLPAGLVVAPPRSIRLFNQDRDRDEVASEAADAHKYNTKRSIAAPLSTSWWNVHTRLFINSLPPLLSFVGLVIFLLYSVHLSTSGEDTNTGKRNELPARIGSLVTALEREVLAAAVLSSLSNNALNTYGEAPPSNRSKEAAVTNDAYSPPLDYPQKVKDVLTSRRVAFLQAVAFSKVAASDLMSFYKKHSSSINVEGSLIRDGIGFTNLDRARDAVLGGGESETSLSLYAQTLLQLSQFVSSVQLRVAAVDPGDLVEVSRIFSIAQWTHSSVLDTFLRTQRLTAANYTSACRLGEECVLPFLAPIETYSGYQLMWQVEGSIPIFEQFLRFAGARPTRLSLSQIKMYTPSTMGIFSTDPRGDPVAYRTHGGTQALQLPASVTVADGLTTASLIRQSVSPVAPNLWLFENRSGTVFGFTYADTLRAGEIFAGWLSFVREGLAEEVRKSGYVRSRLGSSLQFVFLAVSVTAILAGLVNALHGLNSRRRNAVVNAEAKACADALSRMKRFASLLGSGDLSKVYPFIQRYRIRSGERGDEEEESREDEGGYANSRGTPWLEASLYTCLTHLRELEAHMPPKLSIVTPHTALGRQLPQPAMSYERGLVALRVDFAEAITHFSDVPAVQKACHNDHQQLLSLIRLMASVASEASQVVGANALGARKVSSPVVVAYPDHVLVLIGRCFAPLGGSGSSEDETERTTPLISYPASRTTLMAKLISREAKERLSTRGLSVSLSLAFGDAMVGFVGNSPPLLTPSPLDVRVVPFTTFAISGPLTQSLSLMASSALSARYHSARLRRLYSGDGGTRASHTSPFGSGCGGAVGLNLLFNSAFVAAFENESLQIKRDERYEKADWLPVGGDHHKATAPGTVPTPMVNRSRHSDSPAASLREARLRASFVYNSFLKHNRAGVIIEGALLILPRLIRTAAALQMTSSSNVASSAVDGDENALVRAALTRAMLPPGQCSFLSFHRSEASASRAPFLGSEGSRNATEKAGQAVLGSVSHLVYPLLFELLASRQGAGKNANNRRLMAAVSEASFESFVGRDCEGSRAAVVGNFLWAALALKEFQSSGGGSSHHRRGVSSQKVGFSITNDHPSESKNRRGVPSVGDQRVTFNTASSAASLVPPTASAPSYVTKMSSSSSSIDNILTPHEFELLLIEMSVQFVPLACSQGAGSYNTSEGGLSSTASSSLASLFTEVTLTEAEEVKTIRQCARHALVGLGGGDSAIPVGRPTDSSVFSPAIHGSNSSNHKNVERLLQWPSFVERLSQESAVMCERKASALTSVLDYFVGLDGPIVDVVRVKAFLHTLQWLKYMLLSEKGVLQPTEQSANASPVAGDEGDAFDSGGWRDGCMPSSHALQSMKRASFSYSFCRQPLSLFLPHVFSPCTYLKEEPCDEAHLHQAGVGRGSAPQRLSVSERVAQQLQPTIAFIDALSETLRDGLLEGVIDVGGGAPRETCVSALLW